MKRSILLNSIVFSKECKQITFFERFITNITFYGLSISLRFVINLRFTRETESILSKYINITRTLEANPVNAMLISQDQNDTSFQKMDA